MKRQIKSFFTTLCMLVASLSMMAAPVAAEVNFLVEPILPENQKADMNGYFDLMVQPGQRQELSVQITNGGDEAFVVEIETITASTNLNGVVNYTTPGEHAATLAYPVDQLLTVEEKEVVVPARSSKMVTVTLQMPEEEYDGYLLGAIHIMKQLDEAELASGQTILNQYSYVVAVKLTETDIVIENNFEMDGVHADLENGRASIVNRIVNPMPVLVKGMDTTVKIYAQGSDVPIMERHMEGTEMAPNSIFPFTLVDDAGYGIQAGNYRSVVDIAHKDKTWSFETDFVIKAEEAAAINSNAVNQGTQQTAMDTGLPTWALVSIVAGVILLLVVLALLIYLLKRGGAVKQG